MNYEQIREILKDNDNQEVVKGIISFELGIEDEELLDEINEFYFSNKYMPNFLDAEICEFANCHKYGF
ncbi:hypothetical protein [Staphylococcus sp. HMSC034G07]|uniref:hypothetical protein n=1 Tax=Staphylococcus sp. HMSC034G07 TaxID=1715065 RepID=UPI00114D2EB4|nr:hypothetical protein [Staphylococcus sp. HMSC034G07]